METKTNLNVPVQNPLTYVAFRRLVEQLVEEEKTTGPEQTEERINFTKLNLQRMKRVEKQFSFLPELKNLLQENQPRWHWQVLVEAWCGDGAQLLPAIAAIATEVPSIQLTVYLRDENPALMDTCLTNGSRGIPKLICLGAQTGERLFVWGPRPAEIQAQLVAYRAEHPSATHSEFMTQVHTWYAKDRSQALQQDLLALAKQTLAVETWSDYVI